MSAHEYLAVYGLLRQGSNAPDRPRIMDSLTDCGPCEIAGLLYDLGDYPGLVIGSGIVAGQLFEVADASTFRELDRYERYDPEDLKGSLYLRRSVYLVKPSHDAWVYVYNQSLVDKRRVVSGDWLRYREGAVSRRIRHTRNAQRAQASRKTSVGDT
jgi:gamma-glutamylcyclotransferase (GGCT)/AIG2-like uncharacterized protein YtfP